MQGIHHHDFFQMSKLATAVASYEPLWVCMACRLAAGSSMPTPHGCHCCFWKLGPLRAPRILTDRSAIYSHVGYLPRTPPHLVPLSYEQVPHNKRRAEDTCSPEQLLRRTAPLRRALELLVSTSNVLRCIERVFNELVDVRLLHAEVGRERRVQLRDLHERLFGCTAGVSSCSRRVCRSTYRTLSSWSSYCLSMSWFSCANSWSCSGSS